MGGVIVWLNNRVVGLDSRQGTKCWYAQLLGWSIFLLHIIRDWSHVLTIDKQTGATRARYKPALRRV